MIELEEDLAVKVLAMRRPDEMDWEEAALEGFQPSRASVAEANQTTLLNLVVEVLVASVAQNLDWTPMSLERHQIWSAFGWLLVTSRFSCREQSGRPETGRDRRSYLWW